MALMLKATAKAHERLETKEMIVTDLGLKSLLLKKRERAAPRASRVELALSSNLEQEERVEMRDMKFLEEWLCSLTVMAPKVVVATCLTKFRRVSGSCAMRKSFGVRMAQVTPSTAVQKCADGVCA